MSPHAAPRRATRALSLSLAALTSAAALVACDADAGSTTAGMAAGTTAGMAAGTTAGMAAGTTAGMAAGTTAGTTAGATAEEPLAIIGTYTDEFDTAHAVSAEEWVITYPGGAPSVFEIEEFSNDEQALFAHNAAANEYSPNLYSRFDWVVLQGDLWFCQTSYDAETLEAARATPRADESDPAASGCNTFPWSKLVATP